ncbi:MAG TPA: DUF3108 domain-containing protein [Bacteroidota bacterium]
MFFDQPRIPPPAPRVRGRVCYALAMVLLSVAVVCAAPQQAPPGHVLSVGEDLIYNVRYGPFDLGSVRIRALDRQQLGNYLVYYCRAFIDSYPKIPFVDIHATFESYVDTMVYSHKFIGRLKQDDRWDFARYTFDYERKKAVLEKGWSDTALARRDTVMLDRVFQDGLSLFFYARDQLFSGKNVVVPTMINEQMVTTRINFEGKRDAVEIDAVDYPVDVVGFDGTADFTGIYGMTGGFEGWFSNDDARIPIMAKMKVLVGSVTIELMRWKREGWTPPRAKG